MSAATNFSHKTVFLESAINLLQPQNGKLFVDATLGGGGHTKFLLEQFPHATVIGIDWDKSAIENAEETLKPIFGERLILVFSNFVSIAKVLKKLNIAQVDGILADFGTSQHQIFTAAGFSFNQESPLDMRMSNSHKHVTAAHILAQADQDELEYIFSRYGQERFARAIAKKIVAQREKAPLTTTSELAKLVVSIVIGKSCTKTSFKIHPATKVFQALRIAVNHELANIEDFLTQSYPLLAPGGRLVCISFHSLEDRIVKEQFKGFCLTNLESKILTKKPIEADEQDCLVNPSSRSAKMRALQK